MTRKSFQPIACEIVTAQRIMPSIGIPYQIQLYSPLLWKFAWMHLRLYIESLLVESTHYSPWSIHSGYWPAPPGSAVIGCGFHPFVATQLVSVVVLIAATSVVIPTTNTGPARQLIVLWVVIWQGNLQFPHPCSSPGILITTGRGGLGDFFNTQH